MECDDINSLIINMTTVYIKLHALNKHKIFKKHKLTKQFNKMKYILFDCDVFELCRRMLGLVHIIYADKLCADMTKYHIIQLQFNEQYSASAATKYIMIETSIGTFAYDDNNESIRVTTETLDFSVNESDKHVIKRVVSTWNSIVTEAVDLFYELFTYILETNYG